MTKFERIKKYIKKGVIKPMIDTIVLDRENSLFIYYREKSINAIQNKNTLYLFVIKGEETILDRTYHLDNKDLFSKISKFVSYFNKLRGR